MDTIIGIIINLFIFYLIISSFGGFIKKLAGTSDNKQGKGQIHGYRHQTNTLNNTIESRNSYQNTLTDNEELNNTSHEVPYEKTYEKPYNNPWSQTNELYENIDYDNYSERKERTEAYQDNSNSGAYRIDHAVHSSNRSFEENKEIKNYLFSNSKRAFITKELLDKPLSLR